MTQPFVFRNTMRLLMLFFCCCLALPASAQLKSDKKPTDKKEKTKKNPKKEKDEDEADPKEKDSPKKAAKKEKDEETDKPADKAASKTAKPATIAPKDEKPADAAKEDEKEEEDPKDEKEDKNDKGGAPDPDDPTAKTVDVKMTFGPEYTNERRNTALSEILRDEAGNIHIIKTSSGGVFRKDKIYVSAYDSKLNELYDEELDMGKMEGKDLDYDGALVLNHQAYIRSNVFSKAKQKNAVYLFPLIAKGKVGKPKKISEWAAEGEDEGSCKVLVSKDGTKLLAFKTLELKKKDTRLRVEFTVYDQNLEPIWSGKTSFVSEIKGGWLTSHRTGFLRDYMLDNAGRVFVLKETEREGKNKSDAAFITDLYQFVEGDNQPIKYNLDLNQKTIANLSLLETNNPDELVGVGSYAENKKVSWFATNIGSNGTFMFRLNVKSGEVTNKSLKPFTNEMFDFMRISEKAREKGAGIVGLKLVWAYLTPNDNVVLSLEQKYSITTTRRMGPNLSVTTTTYYSQVMFNVKYSSEGKVLYQTFIPKNLTSTEGWFGMSHILAPRGEQHAIVFNDNRKNTEKKLETTRSMSSSSPGGRQCVARLVTLDENGKRKVSTLFSHKEEGFVFSPDVHLNYEKGVLITLAARGKDFKLVKINF
jgi:hypothetical protein